ncbi:hypothetical protein BDW75DRAFT_205187 [Aspergillus navahoensis]
MRLSSWAIRSIAQVRFMHEVASRHKFNKGAMARLVSAFKDLLEHKWRYLPREIRQPEFNRILKL